MKANEFVKKHGWDAVIEAVKTTPLDHNFQSTDLEQKLAKDGTIIGFDCKVYTVSHAEVKRLVESHELIKEHGSIDRAKMYAESIYTAPEVVERLKQAILDVESCQ